MCAFFYYFIVKRVDLSRGVCAIYELNYYFDIN